MFYSQPISNIATFTYGTIAMLGIEPGQLNAGQVLCQCTTPLPGKLLLNILQPHSQVFT